MSISALGQWKNAPLAYVLAQVRFEPIMEMEKKYLTEFQDAIRDRFPRFSRVQRLGFMITEGGVNQADTPPTIWDCLNEDRTKCVRVEQSALTYLATAYTTFEEFSAELDTVVSAFQRIVHKFFVTRIGVRYVDFILPSADKTPEDYVVGPLNTKPDIGVAGEATFFNYYEFPLPGGQLLVKYARGQGKPELPPDLQPLTLKAPSIMDCNPSGPTAVLDTDRILNLDKFMEADELMKSFRVAHSDLSQAFKKVTTDFAKQEWGAK